MEGAGRVHRLDFDLRAKHFLAYQYVAMRRLTPMRTAIVLGIVTFVMLVLIPVVATTLIRRGGANFWERLPYGFAAAPWPILLGAVAIVWLFLLVINPWRCARVLAKLSGGKVAATADGSGLVVDSTRGKSIFDWGKFVEVVDSPAGVLIVLQRTRWLVQSIIIPAEAFADPSSRGTFVGDVTAWIETHPVAH